MNGDAMRDWNVIVTVHGDRFRSACEQLSLLGRVDRTGYYNVLAMRVDQIGDFMETLRDWMVRYPDTSEAIGRVAPAIASFSFQSAQEFEAKAQASLEQFAPQLDEQQFHVRMHRRGWKEMLSRTALEQQLGQYLVDVVAQTGGSTTIGFSDPDYIIAVDTLDNRAGTAIWSREDLRRYPFLKLD